MSRQRYCGRGSDSIEEKGSGPERELRSRPATVLVTGDRAEIIRRAETQEDVFRRDIVPERLRRAAVTTTTEPFQVSR